MKGIKHLIRKTIRSITPSRATFQGSALGIFLISLLFFTLTKASSLLQAVGFGLYSVHLLFYLLIALILASLLGWTIGLLAKTPLFFRISVAFTVLYILYYLRLDNAYGWILISILLLFPALIFGAIAYWKHNRQTWSKRQQLMSFCIGALGFLGLGISLYLFLYPGHTPRPIDNAKMSVKLPPLLQAPDPSKPGDFQVSFLTYGSGKDRHREIYGKEVTIRTPTVDASFLLQSWTGLSGKLRTWYFGFDQTHLPLNAMVWYPKQLQAPAPLVLVVHGNHLAQDWSDIGYDYLGKLLASKGYIVASVDENFINSSFTDLPKAGLNKENGTRGWLLLKHLELWRKWNQDAKSPFYHLVDTNNIALIGHSRGGEAISHAALFNRLPYFPDNANEAFHFNFNIKAYIAIAPVDGQYKPASILAPLQDINYFVIHGTHDMDVKSFNGLATYHRIQYTPDYDGFKAGLYVDQANHGQFNTSWGRYDNGSPSANQYNITNLMPTSEQEQIAKVYISAFLAIHLKGLQVYKPLFTDYRYGRNWLPPYLYFNQYENSKSTFIARYEEDLNLQTATLPGASIHTEHLSVWREAQHQLTGDGHLSRAAYIGWSNEKGDPHIGQYSFNLPDSSTLSLQDKSLIFSLAESKESAKHVEKGEKTNTKNKTRKGDKAADEDKEEKAIDFTIELSDRDNQKIRFLLSECSPLQRQIKKNLSKYTFLNADKDSESIPDFFYFDLHELQRKNTSFAINRLHQISFIFDQSPSGVIILDDIGFTTLRE